MTHDLPFALLGLDHVVLRVRDLAGLEGFYCDRRLRRGPNVDHFCLRVEPFDANAIVGHLHRHGIEPSEVGIRFGADGEGPSSSLYLHDPEGNRIELKGSPSA